LTEIREDKYDGQGRKAAPPRVREPVRVKHLRDPETDDDLRHLAPGERIAMVWPMTVTAWAFMGETVGESRLQRRTVHIHRGTG
jgi:hypothetical protein